MIALDILRKIAIIVIKVLIILVKVSFRILSIILILTFGIGLLFVSGSRREERWVEF